MTDRPDLPSESTSVAAASADRAMVRIEGLEKSFDGKQVLRGVDLSVNPGETMVVIGRSGEGKSVLLKLIMGLIPPDRGSIWVDGEEITHLRERDLSAVRKKIGMLFQGAALFDSLTVRGNVGFALDEERAVPDDEIESRVIEELQRVQLEGILDKRPAELSGGMKKRVGLARALVKRPKVVLYDEPTTGLDPITADAINNLILRMQKELGVTSIVVTHDMASARKVGNHVALLNKGRILFTGTISDLESTDDPYVRQFVDVRAEGPLTQ